MKNQKIILVFTLVIALLLIMINFVKATEIPINIVDPNANNTSTNNQLTNDTNNNNQISNNTLGPVIANTTDNNTTNNTATNTLPQTGVAEDTALFVFIAVCIISAIYAFIRIRNYKNI